MTRIKITTPLTDQVVENLRMGQHVALNGILYAGRDATHEKFFKYLDIGGEPIIDLKGQVVYYVGPSPAKPGQVIGSAGPTTSSRMDAYLPRALALGIKGTIGKGRRSKEVIKAMMQYKAVYFAALGGAAALISKCIKDAKVIAFSELGAEALYELVVEDFPVIVVNDIYGGDLYDEGIKIYASE